MITVLIKLGPCNGTVHGGFRFEAGKAVRSYWCYRRRDGFGWLLIKERPNGTRLAAEAGYLVYLNGRVNDDRCTCPAGLLRRSMDGPGCKHPGMLREFLKINGYQYEREQRTQRV